MTQTINMLAPVATGSYTSIFGSVYYPAPDGIIANVAYQDINSLESQGCLPLGQLGGKNNNSATSAPAATNDNTQGYVVGSQWFDVNTGVAWRATSVATGAAVWVATAFPPPLVAGAVLTLTSANCNQSILLNIASGSVVTMPAAAGTGNVFNIIVSVSTTSAAHKILAASTADFIFGFAYGQNSNAAKPFVGALATYHAIQMPFTGSQPSGGIAGDRFKYTDVAANLWMVEGFYSAGTTPTTPFSATNT